MSSWSAGGWSPLVRPFASAAALLVVLATLLGFGVGRVGAHTDLLQGSPGPSQTVGGTVDFIDLVFVAPVTDVVVAVRSPDGEVVDGEMEVADGQIIRHRMDALTAPGRYVVDYQMISDDGDLTDASYFFVFEQGAFEPSRLGQVDVPDESGFTFRNVIATAAVILLLGACAILALRVRRSRAALVAHRETGRRRR